MGRSKGRESLWGGMWGVTHWGENAMWRVLGMVVWRVEAMAMGGGVTMMVVVVWGTMEA